ncbi:MAG: aminoglycoside phosphotransferase family protein [Candidatus Moraniibacteriota bacterium]|nr:MAG: aminoglycoside phosphotransferase family protein [Candidatus Moranbacteria bacterium]
MPENDVETILEDITRRLVALGELSHPHQLITHSHQGYNSRVYVLSSEKGELVIHLAKPFEHYFTDKIWEKLLAVSTFLCKETGLPISRIIFAEPREGYVVSAQEKLPGDIAGTVAIIDHHVIYTWLQNKQILMPQVQRLLAEIHNLPIAGYGFPVEKNGAFVGTYTTWKEFLQERVQLWLNALRSGQGMRTLEENLYEEITAYAAQFDWASTTFQGSLIHGDLGNPSNILADQERVMGIIDWEFALVGDPAWEFCDEGWAATVEETRLDAYFQARSIDSKEDREAFLRQIILYRPLQCLMWLYVHRNDEDPVIFDTCVALLKKDLREAGQWK